MDLSLKGYRLRVLFIAVITAGILYVLWQPSYEVVGPSPGDGEMTMILLHGYGGSPDSMMSTARSLNAKMPGLTVVIPRAPHRQRNGCGGTWQPDAAVPELVAGRHQTVQEIDGIIDELRAQGVTLETLYLAGFSQGAAMAAYYVTESVDPQPLRGLVLFSGEFIAHGSEQKRRADHLPNDFKVFIAHGDSDRVLPPSRSEAMAAFFENYGVETQYFEFRGGHGIHPTARRELLDFIDR